MLALAALFVFLHGGPVTVCQAAPGYERIADGAGTYGMRDIGSYGMVPVYGTDIADGEYVVETECTSPFFRILEAKLTVKEGMITALMTMSSESYLFVYPGTAEAAAAAALEEYIPMINTPEGRHTFTIPVKALNTPVECAAFSKNRSRWYARRIIFHAADIPKDKLAFTLPDYARIDEAIALYDKQNGTDSRAELAPDEENGKGKAEEEQNEPVSMEEPDGEYSIDVDLAGGSGRASVTTPTWLYVKDGKGYAKLLWSSTYYDYMIVGGKRYLNETTDGGNSTFTIPITMLNEPMEVIADTTAMGDPLEIEYTLTFYGDTIGDKGRIPQEGAKTVFLIALIVMAAGGGLKYYVEKKKKKKNGHKRLEIVMIKMIGIDHQSAGVDVRSVFTFRKQEMVDTMEAVKDALQAAGVILLATCNRMELWVHLEGVHEDKEEDYDLLGALCTHLKLNKEEYAPYFAVRVNRQAMEHLFYLTAGLKSAILAEDQILTQVKDALTFARAHYCTDNVLEVLFRKAVTAAKKVKTEVVFTHANQTAIGEALHMLEQEGFSVQGKKCMVIGNGEYGRLAAETMLRKGADVTVTLRQYHSGVVLIPDGCKTILYGDKMELFPKCDLVVSATTSPNYTLYYDKVLEAKPDKEMILIDFAVPRDIEPKIAEIPGMRLFDIDDFKTNDHAGNEEAFEKADAILKEIMDEFVLWVHSRDLIPHINKISQMAVSDLHWRLEKAVRKLDTKDEEKNELFDHIDSSSGKVVAKLLYLLRDNLEEEAFRNCVGAIENAYEG